MTEPWRPYGISRSLWVIGSVWLMALIGVALWPT